MPRFQKREPPSRAAEPPTEQAKRGSGRPRIHARARVKIKLPLDNQMLHQLDGWREERRIWSRNDAIVQLIRFVLEQPWPLGNAPELDAEGKPVPYHPSRKIEAHKWVEHDPWPKHDMFFQLQIEPTLTHELDEWRFDREILSRTEAVRQIVRFGVHQPWPGGNGPADGPRAKKIEARMADPILRRYPAFPEEC